MENIELMNAHVISVYPDKITITVDKLEDFKIAEESLRVGSYLKIADHDDSILMAIIESFRIEIISEKNNPDPNRKYLIEAFPLGVLRQGIFERGGDSLTIPPKSVQPATVAEIENIYKQLSDPKDMFCFSSLSSNREIRVPINGNKFFNKHIAIVGSTGSGKSHTLSKVVQSATSKNGDATLNNSHIIIFDIHSEYKSAFPDANFIDISNLTLPYWLLNSEELEEILLDTGERDNYNQSSIFRKLVTENKKKYNPDREKVFYDSPLFFDINEVQRAIFNLKSETKNSKSANKYMINDGTYVCTDSSTTTETGIQLNEKERIYKYFTEEFEFYPTKNSNVAKGDYADGTLDKFYVRLQEKINQDRLSFLFGESAKNTSFQSTLESLLGYTRENKSNIIVIDLSGVPFEVLSITVSLISRLLFEYGYYYKRLRCNADKNEKINNDVPILLVYEEAHKYVPKSELSKYRSSKKSIERIAKEGRKYGVTLLLCSQRPSEISETIFSQCNNFIAMRLTNPDDQNYVKRLLPDTLGSLVDKITSLKQGEALIVGESIILPSIVQIDECIDKPSSSDIPYWHLWQEKWKDLSFENIQKEWFE